MLHELIRTWFGWVENWGYLGVFVLMAMESSIIPVPSEIVMPPAAFWAAQGRGGMTFTGVVLAGTLGSYSGSILSYLVSQWLGLPVLKRFGGRLGLSADKLEFAHSWVQRQGAGGVFLARLLPVVRHLVSIPAGILRMPAMRFSVATIAGAGLWCWVLAWFGEQAIGSHPELLSSPEAMVAAIKAKLIWFVAAAVVFTLLYAFVLVMKKRSVAGAPAGALMLALIGAGVWVAALAPEPAHADDIYTIVVKKQEEKEKNHWYLTDWLETRDKMRLMDLWLALHSPSPYEFFLGGSYITGSAGGTSYSGWRESAAAFASIFGLEFLRDTSAATELSAMFDLRVFGFHDQSTNITLQGGLRSTSLSSIATGESVSARNALAGVRMDVYLTRYFGVHGLYRHFFDSTPGLLGAIDSGTRYEGGGFIDFKFLRFGVDYFSQPETFGASDLTHRGVEVGAKVYF